jgi:hypothetical protein
MLDVVCPAPDPILGESLAAANVEVRMATEP